MRLIGHDEVQNIQTSKEIVLRKATKETPELRIEIEPLPPDWDETVELRLPEPQPRILGPEMDKKGRPVFHDGAAILRYDTADSKYRKAKARHQKRQTILMLLDSIKPGQVEFTAPLEGVETKVYCDAVLAEMKEFGFSMGDLLQFVKEIGIISGLTEEDIKAAERSFFVKED